MDPLTLLAGLALGAVGAGADRLASRWPDLGARHQGPGWRTVALALAGAVSGAAVVWQSTLPIWATTVQLVVIGLLLVLVATDLEQHRLPHLVLDPLIGLAVIFAFVNPAHDLVSALIGAAVGLAILGGLGLIIRGGVAGGDLWLVVPLGLILGWPAIFIGLFAAAILSGLVSVLLLALHRVGLRSYIPFGPFLAAGFVIGLLYEPRLTEIAARMVG